MNTATFSAAALALSLGASPAFGAGADGPSFPSLQPVASAQAPSVQLMGASAAPAAPMTGTRTFTGVRRMLLSADTLADEPVIKGEATYSRAEQRAQVIKANRAGEFGHATTPY